jgi:transposase
MDNYLNSLRKLIKKIKEKGNQFDFIEYFTSIADLCVPLKYSPARKFTHKDFFKCFLEFVETRCSWSKFRASTDFPISGKYLNHLHNQYVRSGLYQELFRQVLDPYFTEDKAIKTKCQIADTSYIPNKQGSVHNNNIYLCDSVKEKNREIRESNEQIKLENDQIKLDNLRLHTDTPLKRYTREQTFIDFCRYNGRKRYLKISVITDAIGTPISVTITPAKECDVTSLKNTVDNIPIDLNTLKLAPNNRLKQHMLADAGYYSNSNKNYLTRKGYDPIIGYNKKNTKDINKIKKNALKGRRAELYKIRPKVESFFSWAKNYPSINQNYQKTIDSYYGIVLFVSAVIVAKRITKKFW